MVITYPRIVVVALLVASGGIVAGCGAAVDPTAPTAVVTATIAVQTIDAIRETTVDGANLYHVSFEVRETKGETGATVKAVDLQFNNGYTPTFGADSVPHVGAGRTVESKRLSAEDPLRAARGTASSVSVRVLATDDKGTDSVSLATKAVLNAYVLFGNVTEAGTGRPIVGATVRITFGPDAGRSATTNASGRYEFRTVVQGPISLTLNASGHVQQTRTVDMAGDIRLDVALIRS